ncbi:MAG: DMT family transporter [Acetobacteraceae bacterium]
MAPPERARIGRAEGRALASLFLLTLIWGLSIPAMKLGLADMPPAALVTLRYLVAAPVFALLLRRWPRPRPRALAVMAALGLFGVDLGQYAQMAGVARCPASVATIITAVIPVLTVVLVALRLGQRLRPVHGAGFALALAGVALAVWQGGAAATPRALGGEALVGLSTLCIAGYYAFGAEVAAREGALPTAAWSTIFAALGLLATALVTQPRGAWQLDPRVILVALYLGLLVTVAGMLIWLRALATVPARIAGATQYGQPLVGIAASAALFGDPLGPRFLLGTALVLGGVALSALRGR